MQMCNVFRDASGFDVPLQQAFFEVTAGGRDGQCHASAFLV